MKPSNITEILKDHMKSEGITQQGLADKLMVSQANVSSTLSGKLDIRVSTLINYCDKLGLEIKIEKK